MSRNTFHVGCWPILHAAEYQCFKVVIMKLLQNVLLSEVDEEEENASERNWSSDEEVCTGLGLMHLVVLLRYMRSCTAVRLAGRVPRPFREIQYAARYAKRSWLEAVMQDLNWMKWLGSTFEYVNVNGMA